LSGVPRPTFTPSRWASRAPARPANATGTCVNAVRNGTLYREKGGGQTIDLLDERDPPAPRLPAAKPSHTQLDDNLLTSHRHIRQSPLVAMRMSGQDTTARTGSRGHARPCLDHHTTAVATDLIQGNANADEATELHDPTVMIYHKPYRTVRHPATRTSPEPIS